MVNPGWKPYLLTEHTVSSQADLLRIVLELEDLRSRSKHSLPVLVDMDIHYRIMKMLYGQGLKEFRMREKMPSFPFLYVQPGFTICVRWGELPVGSIS